MFIFLINTHELNVKKEIEKRKEKKIETLSKRHTLL